MADPTNIHLYYYKDPAKPNLGDELSPYIVEKLSGKNAVWVDPRADRKALFSTGSIAGTVCHDSHVVWGSGFLDERQRLGCNPTVTAIRGAYSLAMLPSPSADIALGDPALLMPQIYTPKTLSSGKRWRLGIIPHYMDQPTFLERYADRNSGGDEILVLNIVTDKVEGFVDLLCQCEMIASSSLHGLILAHAYGIPALWVEFSDKVIGNGFKFFDYFSSISIAPYNAVGFQSGDIRANDILNAFPNYLGRLGINNYDPDPLKESFEKTVEKLCSDIDA